MGWSYEWERADRMVETVESWRFYKENTGGLILEQEYAGCWTGTQGLYHTEG